MKRNNYLLAVLVLFFSVSAFADLQTDFRNATLKDVVPVVSNITKKAFTFSPKIADSTIFLTMPLELSREESYSLFKDALKASNLKAYEKVPGLVTIVSADNERYKQFPAGYSTIVLYVENVTSKDVIEGLSHLVSYEGFIRPVSDSVLLITDFNTNISEIRKQLKIIDSLLYSPQIQKAIILNNLLPSAVQAPKELILYPYDDISRLVVSGNKKEVEAFAVHVSKLDNSIHSLQVKLLITSVSQGFTEEFNIIPLFSSGALSLSLGSLSLNSLGNAKEGLSVLADLLTSHTDVTVHSRPFLQLTEGKPGFLNVGRELPIVVSVIDQETGQTVRNIQRKKIGLSVDLEAKVRPDGKVYLKLNQNLSSISETQIANASDIITDDQTLETDLLLDPGKIYAVGGLTDNRKSLTRSGFKYLPIFDSTDESTSSQEILIFVEVTII